MYLGVLSSLIVVSRQGVWILISSYPSSNCLLTVISLRLSAISNSSTYETWGIPSFSASCGPTCAVSPSIACLPVKIRSKSPFSLTHFLMPASSVFEVAHVSDPPTALSEIRKPSSAPFAIHSNNRSFACGGPIVITETVTSSNLSLIFKASSKALASSLFKMLGTPSLIKVPVLGLILITFVSGTCFAHTKILNAICISSFFLIWISDLR